MTVDFVPMKIYVQNDWSVTMMDERVYLVVDANGRQCKTSSVRMINSDEIVIDHPIASPIRINTRRFKSLPGHCIGDLFDKDTIDNLRHTLIEPVVPETMMVYHDIRTDRVGRANASYHGEHGPR